MERINLWPGLGLTQSDVRLKGRRIHRDRVERKAESGGRSQRTRYPHREPGVLSAYTCARDLKLGTHFGRVNWNIFFLKKIFLVRLEHVHVLNGLTLN